MTTVVRAVIIFLVKLLAGAQAYWVGCAPEPRQRIYYANHTSHLDTLAVFAALPPSLRPRTHPVAALDYWGGSGLKRTIAVECLNAVLIDRGGGHERDPLAPLADLLERGESLIIFPEGTRGTGPVGPFKSGLFHLARRFPNAELVPVNIENLHRILPKGTWLLVPLICTLRIGAPIHVGVGEPKDVFLARARADLIALGRPV